MILKYLPLLLILFSFSLFSQEFTPGKKSVSIPELEKHIEMVYEASKSNVSKELNSEQKAYIKKNYKNRFETTLAYIKAGAIIDSGLIYNKVDSLFQVIIDSNPSLLSGKKIYIINEPTANAFTFGDDVIYIHLGLIYRVQNKEELMLVICHEIAHNEMNHYDKKNIDYAKTIINDSLEKELRKIYNKEFGQVSALNELFTPWILSNKAQSRAFENEADSLAISYFKNTAYKLEKAGSIYSILKNAEHERDTSALDLKSELNLPANVDFTKHLSYTITNSLGTFEKKKDTLKELLRTHPYPEEREIKFKAYFNAENASPMMADDEIKDLKYFTESEMIIQSMKRKNLGKSLFYWIQLQKKYPEDIYFDHFLTYAFAILAYEKTARRENSIIESVSINVDENYDHLLYFLRKLSPKECLDLSKYYLDQIDKNTSSQFIYFAQAIIFGLEKDYENFKRISKNLDKTLNGYEYIINEIYSKTE